MSRITYWGDSNVVDSVTGAGSFRKVLQDAANATDFPMASRGIYSDAFGKFSGFNGWATTQLIASFGSLVDNTVDTHIIHVGTNDVLQALGLGTSSAQILYRAEYGLRMIQLLDLIRAATPNADVYICTIPKVTAAGYLPPFYDGDIWTQQCNAQLAGVVTTQRAKGQRCTLLDTRTAAGTNLVDGVHYNATGQAAVATVIYQAIIHRASDAVPLTAVIGSATPLKVIATLKISDLPASRDFLGLPPNATFRVIQD